MVKKMDDKEIQCPYCKQIMKGGTIQSLGELVWNPGIKKKMPGAFKTIKETVMLSKFDILAGSACIAYCCSNCNKIIIDYSELTDVNKIRR